MPPLAGASVLITGGTGSLGKNLIRRILTGEAGQPSRITVFSRDEAKQHALALSLEEACKTSKTHVDFRLGDVRDPDDIDSVIAEAEIVINAAALKQVPTCEHQPFEAVKTNVIGAENIVRAVERHDRNTERVARTVVCISTDKACKPVNAMGMSKALQERIFLHEGNARCLGSRFIAVRYGNVIASRGSVLPLFRDQIRRGEPCTITTIEMTRFLLTLDQAIDTIFAALAIGHRGELFVPCVGSANILDVVDAAFRLWSPKQSCSYRVTGIRPGEKIHEILLSEEECPRTSRRSVNGKPYFVISPSVPVEPTDTLLGISPSHPNHEYSSADNVMSVSAIYDLLRNVDVDAAS